MPYASEGFNKSTNLRNSKSTDQRRRQACGKALGRLKKLAPTEKAQQNSTKGRLTAEQLVSIMKNYIGEKFDKTAGSLTPDDCYDAIIAATDDTQSADEYMAIIAGFEAGRYSPTEIKIDSDKLGKISELIRSIEKNSRK